MSVREFERPIDSACPHDGWYNGNMRLMVENGTFDDYREKLLVLVEKKKIAEADFKRIDAEWQKIDIVEKKRRRDMVIDDTTFKPVRLKNGQIELQAKPSDNGAPSRRPEKGNRLSMRGPKGSLARKPDPFAAQIAARASKNTKGAQNVPSPAGIVPPLDPKQAQALGAAPVPQVA